MQVLCREQRHRYLLLIQYAIKFVQYIVTKSLNTHEIKGSVILLKGIRLLYTE